MEKLFHASEKSSFSNQKIDPTSSEILMDVRNQIESSSPVVKIDANIKGTKAQGKVTVTYARDLELEKFIETFNHESIHAQLHHYDPTSKPVIPQHYPVKILSALGHVATGENVFLALPLALGLPVNHPSEHLGFEHIDVWRAIADQVIFPFLFRVLSKDSLAWVMETLQMISPDLIKCIEVLDWQSLRDRGEISFKYLDKIIYGAAILHEYGHMAGPMKVLPATSKFSCLNELYQGCLGETAANCISGLLAEDRPEVALWQFLFNFAFFGRKGYLHSPKEGQINADNDSLSALVFYQWFRRYGFIEISENKLNLQPKHLFPAIRALRKTLDQLAEEALVLPIDEMNLKIFTWLSDLLPVQNSQFYLPKELAHCYGQFAFDVPEKPRFRPLQAFQISA